MRFRPNVYCFLLRFWQETVLADRPLIEYAGDSERAREMVRVLTPSLLAAAELVVGDMIRYGVGLFVNRVPWTIQAGEPRWWYPVRTPYMSPPPQDLGTSVSLLRDRRRRRGNNRAVPETAFGHAARGRDVADEDVPAGDPLRR